MARDTGTTTARGRGRRWVTLGLAVVLGTTALAACSDNDGDDDAGSDRAPSGDPLVVETDLGTVQGAESAIAGVRNFLAIPYAAAPTGENRWRPPQPRDPYDMTFDATQRGGSCPQNTEGLIATVVPSPPPVEDCLTLDVWAPDNADGLPVMVWIHGGGLNNGSAHQDYYVGDDLAAEGVVVVGINYRLGPFGFLATDELEADSEDGSFGNDGFADQVAALEWVQENVAGFGGDPDNVTIFGESAGGFSVCGHLASEASDGLFHRAIIQSGGGCDRLADPEEAKAAGAELLAEAGCEDIACLRELPSEELAALPFSAALVDDGVLLSETGATAAERGDLDGIEIMIGANAEEMTLFTLTMPEPAPEELPGLFASVTDDPEALLALYPAEEFASSLERYRAMLTDVTFVCPSVAFADIGSDPTYLYHFTFASPNDPFGVGATHGIELAPLFAHPEGIVGLEPGLSGVDAAVSDAMQAAWVAFATDGDPGEGWEPYADEGRATIIDEPPFVLADEIRGGRCDAVSELADAAL